MKKLPIYLVLLVLVAYSCGEKWIEKPENLIPEKKMVDILVDIHIGDAIFSTRYITSIDSLELSYKDFYYSALQNHGVSDTLFEKSLLYYVHYSKDYEKMYAKVFDKLSLMEQEFSKEENTPVDIGNKPEK